MVKDFTDSAVLLTLFIATNEPNNKIIDVAKNIPWINFEESLSFHVVIFEVTKATDKANKIIEIVALVKTNNDVVAKINNAKDDIK